jgi:hypothetical protein
MMKHVKLVPSTVVEFDNTVPHKVGKSAVTEHDKVKMIFFLISVSSTINGDWNENVWSQAMDEGWELRVEVQKGKSLLL